MANPLKPISPTEPPNEPPVPERDPGTVRSPGIEEPPGAIPDPRGDGPRDRDRLDTPESIEEPDPTDREPSP
jgi:hypothetical protein